jgi:Secretion system C-terminal sorting domain
MSSLGKLKFNSLNMKVNSNCIKLALVPVFFWITFFDFSQSETIIINPTLIYMQVHDVVDTAVSSYTPFGCATKSYKLDVDQNNVTDFTLTTSCYMGGAGGDNKITLSSSDSSYFAIDTNVIDTIGSIVAGQIVYNPAYFSLVKAYEWNDSINMEECNQQAVNNIVDYSYGNFPSFISYHSMDSWISGDHYIGFRKQINGINHLGWIKLSVSNYNQFVVKEYALSFLDSPIKIYPNPVVDNVTIQSGYLENSDFKVYNLLGEIVLQSKLVKGLNQVDLSELRHGVYFLQVSGLDYLIQKQIVKL